MLLVIGGTGLAGSNIALGAVVRGRRVRVVVRHDQGLATLREAGVEVVTGDVTQPETIATAMRGVSEVVNAAAVLSGTWSRASSQQMWQVNHQGALDVLDAARESGVRRCVHLDSRSIWDAEEPYSERSPLIPIGPDDSAYVQAKRAAYVGALHRAALGQDIVFVTPAAIYGPGPLVERALDPTSFTRVALRGILGELDQFIAYPMLWTYALDLAEVVLKALERGAPGRRYLAMGRAEDASSLAEFCNAAAEAAGSPHRVRDIDPNDPSAPDIGTMRQFVGRRYADPLLDASWTNQQLELAPTPRPQALATTVGWLREHGQLDDVAWSGGR